MSSNELRGTTLADDDCIALMSGGFTKMFSETGAMIGDRAVIETLCEAASELAQRIVDRFVETGEKWAEIRPPDDDVTFVVVVKVKSGA